MLLYLIQDQMLTFRHFGTKTFFLAKTVITYISLAPSFSIIQWIGDLQVRILGENKTLDNKELIRHFIV